MQAKALMIQGTGSDVGKSAVVAALCRIARRRGLKVAPFKPQNMSNNAAACAGGEIGRAQALQAQAAGLAPRVDFNPILLKPETDRGAQVVVRGKVFDRLNATDYMTRRGDFMNEVLRSFKRLTEAYELILVEGAGSPAEINLRDSDIANMGFAHKVAIPVVLIGDIDKGGPRIVAPILSRIANFDDADPLRMEPGVDFRWAPPGKPLPRDADVIILFGSKSTVSDLSFLRAQGWDHDILAHARSGGRVLGLCGGFQMLGKSIVDRDGADGPPGETSGLGLLDVYTEMSAGKTVRSVQGHYANTSLRVSGYEIHVGRTCGKDTERPMFNFSGRAEGAVSADGLIQGSYVHGVFASNAFRRAWLRQCGAEGDTGLDYPAAVERSLDELADAVEKAVDIEALLACAARPTLPRNLPA